MPIEIVPFEPRYLKAVIRFSENTWARPQTEAFYRWRYLECPSQIGLLALEDGECLAMVWAFVQSYQVGPRRLNGLETFDWFCLPELQGSGLGVRVMQAMMNRPEFIIAAGGTADTLKLLPRLKWRTHGELVKFTLPLEGAALSMNFKRRFGLPTSVGKAIFKVSMKPWFHARPKLAIEGSDVRVGSDVEPEILQLYASDTGDASVRVPNPRFVSWLRSGFPNRVQFLPLYFRIRDALRGWSLTCIYRTSLGWEADIFELFAPQVSEDVYTWMVAETVSAISAYRPDRVHAGASVPSLQQALHRNRFIRRRAVPIQAWWTGPADLLRPIHLTNDTGDALLLTVIDKAIS